MIIKPGTLRRTVTPQGTQISFQSEDYDEIDKLFARDPSKPLRVDFKSVREKRSLNANAYHYKLCDEIAKAIRSTQEEVHTSLMTDYGTPYTDAEGHPVFVLLKADSQSVFGMYLRPTGQFKSGKDGDYQWYITIKPSHEYDTDEMARLIDGTVYEAKELGIETMPPAEIERLKSLWGD